VSPLPVRVDPRGELHAVPQRGTAFGNRGLLHDADRAIVRGWQGRRWIICVTSFGGRRREVLPVGGFTGLFFRDEATALAAGHRPCFECRRADAQAFLEATGCAGGVEALDRLLHGERLVERARPRDGIVEGRRIHPVDGEVADGALALWSDETFGVRLNGGWRRWGCGPLGGVRQDGEVVGLLTPPTALAALRAGYRPVDVPLVVGGEPQLP
jgi:hypothetical protein